MKFGCPHCGNNIEAGPDWYGQATTCPHCAEGFEVPDPSESLSAPGAGSNPAASSPQIHNPTLRPALNRSKPDASYNPARLVEITELARTSLTYGIISFFCFGVILAPIAIFRAKKALGMIAYYQIGYKHLGRAKAGYTIGIISLILAILAIITKIYLLAKGYHPSDLKLGCLLFPRDQVFT